MSIRTGKRKYSSIQEFSDRTRRELAYPEGVVFKRDTEPPQDEVEWIRSRLRYHLSVLELGSGFGIWANVAASVNCEYEGVEPVAERVLYAREHNPGVTFHQADATTVRLPRTFSAVLFVTVLQHMNLTDKVAALKTAVAHLEPGGRIIMMESLILDRTEAECEKLYKDPDCSPHMIPAPIAVLKEVLPGFTWDQQGHDRYVLKGPA